MRGEAIPRRLEAWPKGPAFFGVGVANQTLQRQMSDDARLCVPIIRRPAPLSDRCGRGFPVRRTNVGLLPGELGCLARSLCDAAEGCYTLSPGKGRQFGELIAVHKVCD